MLLVAIDPAGEPHAERTGVEFVGLAFAIEGDRGDEKALRAGFDQSAKQLEAKAARFGHAIDDQAFGGPLLDLKDQLMNLRGA